MELKKSLRLRKSTGVAWAVDGEHVVLLKLSGLREETPVALSESASVIWTLVDNEVTVFDLVEQVKHHFGGGAQDVENEVREFLRQLLADQLIEIV